MAISISLTNTYDISVDFFSLELLRCFNSFSINLFINFSKVFNIILLYYNIYIL